MQCSSAILGVRLPATELPPQQLSDRSTDHNTPYCRVVEHFGGEQCIKIYIIILNSALLRSVFLFIKVFWQTVHY